MLPHPPEMPPPWNHVFVDFENVHEIDFTLLSKKPATFTILVGAKQSRMDMKLVEEMMRHAGAVHLIRLTSSGKNALDFTLAYYLGRAAAADPSAYFHIISKDTGFDPLVEHLRSRQIHIRRHSDYSALTFSHPAKAATDHAGSTPSKSAKPAASSSPTKSAKVGANRGKPNAGTSGSPDSATTPNAPKSPTTPTAPVTATVAHESPENDGKDRSALTATHETPLNRALAHLRRNPNNRPKRKKTLLSHLHSLLGKTAREEDAPALLKELEKRHLTIGGKDTVKYHL